MNDIWKLEFFSIIIVMLIFSTQIPASYSQYASGPSGDPGGPITRTAPRETPLPPTQPTPPPPSYSSSSQPSRSSGPSGDPGGPITRVAPHDPDPCWNKICYTPANPQTQNQQRQCVGPIVSVSTPSATKNYIWIDNMGPWKNWVSNWHVAAGNHYVTIDRYSYQTGQLIQHIVRSGYTDNCHYFTIKWG